MPAPQALARVRCDRVRSPAVAPDGHHVVAQIRIPEGGLEAPPHLLGLRVEAGGQLVLAAAPGKAGHPPLGIEDVALDLRQRDRRLDRRPGPVADGVARVLPALVDEPLRRATLVGHEPVRAGPVLVDPAEGGEGGRPVPIDEAAVARPVVRRGEEDEPQRRRVDAAVVRRVGQFPGPGHLAGPELVEDLARLRIAPVVDRRRLPGGEDVERLDGDGRPEGERLEARDERVATEQGRVPRDAGRHVSLAGVGPLVGQEAQVRQAPPDGEVEQLVVRVEDRRMLGPGPVGLGAELRIDRGRSRELEGVAGPAAVAISGSASISGRDRRADARPDRPAEGRVAARGEPPAPAQDDSTLALAAGGDGVRCGRIDVRPPRRSVEAGVGEGDPPVASHGDGEHRPALRSLPAANLEDVGRVDVDEELDREVLGVRREVRDPDPLVEPGREDAISGYAERLTGEGERRIDLAALVGRVVGVGELDRAPVVRPGVGPEEDGPRAVDAQGEARDDAGVAEVEAEAAAVRMDVAEAIGEQVELAVLEDLDPAEVGRMDDLGLVGRQGPHRGVHTSRTPVPRGA